MTHLKKILLAGGALASLAAAKPAHAFADSCVTLVYPAFTTSCDAGPVPANAKSHFIYYSVSAFGKYWLRDNRNGVLIRYGNAGWRGKHETVFGLYSDYVLTVKSYVASKGYIDNNG